MGRRRPTRRPWVSSAALACLVTLTIASGWITVEFGNWFGNRTVADADRGYWFMVHSGRVGFGYTVDPRGVGFEIDPSPSRWQAVLGGVGVEIERQSRPEWQWAHTWLGFGTSLVLVAIPLWWFAAPLLAWTAWRWHRFKPLVPGACPECRYDAAGLDDCPECGRAITGEQSQRA